jgi:Carboxypeptidase regulatory-like domain
MRPLFKTKRFPEATRVWPTQLLILILFAASTSAVWAQTGLARISGRVTDASGAVVPGVSVVATNTATGIETKTVSNSSGYYELLQIQPGTYTVEADSANFKKLVQSGLIVQVEDRIGLDLHLEVGNVSQTVSVSATAPLLRTEDPQTGEVIDYQMIQTLPQLNRDPLALLTLSGNVQGNGARAGTTFTVSSTGSVNEQTSDTRVNGGRTSGIDYLVDGVSVVTGQSHGVNNVTPGMDDVAEFKVITNGADAAIGRVSGGAVTLVTKSGTNQLHGQGYEYYQNDGLNDSGWEQKALGGKKTPYHQWDTGLAIGGPIVLPHLYHGRDKTFFFVTYEGVRNATSGTLLTTSFPTASERAGDESTMYMTASDGTITRPTMYTPCFTASDCSAAPVVVPPGQANSGSSATQKLHLLGGDGMHVPQSMISPTSAAILAQVPMPNHAPSPGTSDGSNFVGPQDNTGSSDVWSIRIDHQFTESNHMFGRFTHASNSSVSTAWAGPLTPAPTSKVPGGYGLTIDYDYIISPTLSLTLTAGGYYSPFVGGALLPSDFNNSKYGFDSATESLLAGNMLTTTVNFMNGTPSSQNASLADSSSISVRNSTSFQFGGFLTKVLKQHTFQFGGESRRFYDSFDNSGSGSAIFIGDPVTQYSYDAGYGSLFSNVNSMGPYLLGLNDLMSATSPFGRSLAQNYYAAYVQDSYKVNSRLTLNLGIRWDMESPTTERHDKLFIWDPSAPPPFSINPGYNWNAAVTAAGLDPGSIQTPGWVANGFPNGAIRIANTPEHPSRYATGYHPAQFAPRVGGAYKLTNKTVVRGYFGVMYLPTTGDPNAFGSVPSVQVTGGAANAWHQNNFGVDPTTANWTNPYFPSQITNFTRNNQTANFQSTGGIGAAGVVPSLHMPHEYDWNVGVQRELPHNFLIEANYSANASSSLLAPELISRFPKNLFVPANQATYTTELASPTAGQTNSDAVAGPMQLLAILEYPYPYFATVNTEGQNIGKSNYESLNLRLEKRFDHGFQTLVNYSFSRLLDNIGGPEGDVNGGISVANNGGVGNTPVQSVDTVQNVYGLSPLDERHRLTVFYLYQLPFGRGRTWMATPSGLSGHLLEAVAGGWEFSGTTGYRSGRPIVFYDSNINTNNNIRVETTFGSCAFAGCSHLITSGFKGGKSVLVAPGQANPAASSLAFNLAGFEPAQAFTYGTLPPVYGGFRNPGDFTSDLSLMKNFPVLSSDGTRYVQFRAEASNAFNVAGLGPYNNTFNGTGFGTITSVANTERHVQLSLRFIF